MCPLSRSGNARSVGLVPLVGAALSTAAYSAMRRTLLDRAMERQIGEPLALLEG